MTARSRPSPSALRPTALAAALVFIAGSALAAPEQLPTGQFITPTAAPGAVLQTLNPKLPSLPGFTAGQAVSSVVSPDGKTLLVLTSGYNRNATSTGAQDNASSNEYVFVFDISAGGAPVQKQVLQLANTYVGMAFAPNGSAFYVSGGVDDSVHVFRPTAGVWAEVLPAIALNNGPGNGLTKGIPGVAGPTVGAQAAGLALSADGKTLAVANYENDSISLVTLATGLVRSFDLRPGKINPANTGVAGGEFPYWVAFKGNDTLYVSSLRDREIDVLSLANGGISLGQRIALKGNPNKMILNRAQTRLFVACDNSDTVDIIDTGSNTVVGSIDPTNADDTPGQRRGSSPNALVLSRDEETLFVSNGGSNSVAVVELNGAQTRGEVQGLIPTGWYPNAVSLSADGRTLYVANGKGNAGPNPGECTDVQAGPVSAVDCPASTQNGSANQYVWQLTKAGLLSLPVPYGGALRQLSETVAENNGFGMRLSPGEQAIVDGLRQRIHHVIYIVKENRTYDQILGDIGTGNGDPRITQFPDAITPNFHAIARNFTLLDNFYCSGEVSMDGWQWSTGARTIDANDKSTSVNYAGRGMTYDSEGTSRGINTGVATLAQRAADLPLAPALSSFDPDVLPGAVNEVELDGPEAGQQGAGYIWNAALRAGKSVRNYGFFLDLTRYNIPQSLGGIPAIPNPYTVIPGGLAVAFSTHPDLQTLTDPYFRGFDNNLPDFFRVQEWAREFDQFVAGGNLPQFEMVRVMHDHMGNFGTATAGVNTPELQQADNDYAVGLILQKIAASPYKDDTLVFVLEDDAQDGPDHVDAHRSTGYIAGPYVRQGVTVSTHYTTVNMIRTIEDVLGLHHLNLHDDGVKPMTDVFDLAQASWTFHATPSAYLYGTQLAPLLPPQPVAFNVPKSTHAAAWWAQQTRGMDFSAEDRIDADAFNRILWKGLKGDLPYPSAPSAKAATVKVSLGD